VASDQELAADTEANLWRVFSVFGAGAGGGVVDQPDRLITHAPIAKPPYNGVWRFYPEPDRDLESQIDEVLAEFDARDVAPLWLWHPSSPRAVAESLTRRGWERELVRAMGRTLDDIEQPPPAPENVSVKEETFDDEGMVSWRYGLDTSTSPYLREIFAESLERGARLWIARIDGEPVSKVVMQIHNGVAGIYGVATIEKGRGLGLASILTHTALHAAKQAGAKRSILHSTPMAHSLYERMGYHDVANFELFARPGTFHL
jgi:ribosomal protein S18 acetylase RimI-like enzyme